MENKENNQPQPQQTLDIIYLVHGLSATKTNTEQYWSKFIEYLIVAFKCFKNKPYIRVCQSNSGYKGTSDGIMNGGIRIANEITMDLKRIKDLNKANKYRIHLIGHCVGGLFMRVAVGILMKRGIIGENVTDVLPITFMTLETPHLGARFLLDKKDVFDKIVQYGNQTAYAGTTFDELTLKDRPYPIYDVNEEEELPIIFKLAQENSIYVKALSLFRYKTLIQNISTISTTSYGSAAIDYYIPYNRQQVAHIFMIDAYDFNERHTSIIPKSDRHYNIQQIQVLPKKELFMVDNIDKVEYFGDSVNVLNNLGWRRINVNFPQAPSAHDYLIGKCAPNLLRGLVKNPLIVDFFIKQVTSVLALDIELIDPTIIDNELKQQTQQQQQTQTQPDMIITQ